MTAGEHSLSTADLDAAMRPGAVVPVFQPIVDLHDGSVRAYEALARWPDHRGLTPDAVFAAAQTETRLVDLDWACRVAAVEAVLATPVGTNVAVFINVEPESLGTIGPQLLARRWARDTAGLPVVLELTERSMLHHPAEVLRSVVEARDRGMGVALDDVGADPGSLAMLDLVAPDVVKLDLGLVQETPAREQARTLAAVMAYRERTSAVVLAEGIETAKHLEQAKAWGADLGQGWLFGRPAPLPTTAVPASTPLRYQPIPPRTGTTPIDIARRHLHPNASWCACPDTSKSWRWIPSTPRWCSQRCSQRNGSHPAPPPATPGWPGRRRWSRCSVAASPVHPHPGCEACR